MVVMLFVPSREHYQHHTTHKYNDVIEAHCYGIDKGSDRFSSGHVAGQ